MTAAMGRSHFPAPTMYNTPQSNSPASVQSPHHEHHARSLYGQQAPSMSSHLYYSQMSQPNPYGQTYAQQMPPPSQQAHAHAQLGPPPLLMSHNSAPTSYGPQTAHPQTPVANASPHPRLPQTPLQRPSSTAAPQTGLSSVPAANAGALQSATPGVNQPANSGAAPGPIPATTPLVVRQDQNGVQWIAFEYSRDRVKMEYTIRCDVESVNVDDLEPEFKGENCVYPRANCPKSEYHGNRLQYESECNQVGWALASLNQCLRGKRGLIQRAVDSWRNSNADAKLRSRRVRRMSKMNARRSQAQAQGHVGGGGGGGGGTAAAAASGSAPLPGSGALSAGAVPRGSMTIGGTGYPSTTGVHAGGHDVSGMFHQM